MGSLGCATRGAVIRFVTNWTDNLCDLKRHTPTSLHYGKGVTLFSPCPWAAATNTEFAPVRRTRSMMSLCWALA